MTLRALYRLNFGIPVETKIPGQRPGKDGVVVDTEAIYLADSNDRSR